MTAANIEIGQRVKFVATVRSGNGVAVILTTATIVKRILEDGWVVLHFREGGHRYFTPDAPLEVMA